MIKNWLRVAFRNLLRHKGYSLINLLGLAVGLTCAILILLFVRDELSFDRYAPKADSIYRVALEAQTANRGLVRTARTPPPWAPALARDYPEVLNFVRFKTPLVSWLVGSDERDKRFHEKGFYFADPSVFEVFGLPEFGLQVGYLLPVRRRALRHQRPCFGEDHSESFGREDAPPAGEGAAVEISAICPISGARKHWSPSCDSTS